jgi:hypothetical protein
MVGSAQDADVHGKKIGENYGLMSCVVGMKSAVRGGVVGLWSDIVETLLSDRIDQYPRRTPNRLECQNLLGYRLKDVRRGLQYLLSSR